MTFAEYVARKDAELAAAQARVQALRYELDILTAGTWDDVPAEFTVEETYRINRAAFAAMNTDWDLGAARRALQAARDRLSRNDARTTAGTTTGDASPKE